jgi:fatty acyl-CoA reductase
MATSYSIVEHFSESAVLLTGASGYVGALVLEKLLRCTNINAVYVMLRAKKGEDIQSRLNKMLNSSPVMHLLRHNPVLQKVKAIAGDMTSPDLGISSVDLARLKQHVQTVIHCAADIRLEVGIQTLLQTNYEGTRHLLELASSFDDLKAFVHVSSAYTNMNATPGSLVSESLYPLKYGDQLVVDSELVQVSTYMLVLCTCMEVRSCTALLPQQPTCASSMPSVSVGCFRGQLTKTAAALPTAVY